MGYKDVYAASMADPEKFWMEATTAVDWVQPPSRALFDRGDNLYEWYADGLINGCYNAVDRHVEAGRGDQLAIIHDSPITDSVSRLTYAQLQTRVAASVPSILSSLVDLRQTNWPYVSTTVSPKLFWRHRAAWNPAAW